jgi:hypothetical protein
VEADPGGPVVLDVDEFDISAVRLDGRPDQIDDILNPHVEFTAKFGTGGNWHTGCPLTTPKYIAAGPWTPPW